MKFDEFLQAYDLADITWELFKGLSPTIIALITIITNNVITKKRSIREKRDNEIKEIQEIVIDLIPLVLNVGCSLLDYLENKANNREKFNKFLSDSNNMMLEFRKCKYLFDIKSASLNNDMICFEDMFRKGYIYLEKVEEIHNQNINKVKVDMNDSFETALWRAIGDELTLLSNDLIKELNSFCNRITE